MSTNIIQCPKSEKPGVLVQWDDLTRAFLRKWTPELGSACALQTLFIYEQVWRWQDCGSTIREVSGEALRTGIVNGERKHAGLGISRKTFYRHLQEAKRHGLIETTEHADKRHGYRPLTTFHVFPEQVLAGPRSPAKGKPEGVFRGSYLPTAMGQNEGPDNGPRGSKLPTARGSKLPSPVGNFDPSKQTPRKAGSKKAGSSIGGASLAEIDGQKKQGKKVEPIPANTALPDPSERKSPPPKSPPPVVPVDVEAIQAAKDALFREQVEFMKASIAKRRERADAP